METLALLNHYYPAWSLTDLKKIPHRQREWWIKMGEWKRNRLKGA